MCQELFSICHLQWLSSHKSSWKAWLLCPFYRWGDWVSERFGKLPGVTQLRKSFHSVLKWTLLLWLTQKTVALLHCVSWVPSTGTSSKDVTHQWVAGIVSGFAGLSRTGIKMLLCSCLQIDCSRNLPPDFSKQASLPAWHQECGSNCWGWKLWFGLAWAWSWTSGSLNGPKIGQTHDNIDLSASLPSELSQPLTADWRDSWVESLLTNQWMGVTEKTYEVWVGPWRIPCQCGKLILFEKLFRYVIIVKDVFCENPLGSEWSPGNFPALGVWLWFTWGTSVFQYSC